MTEMPPSVLNYYLRPNSTVGDVIKFLNQAMLTHAIRKAYLRNFGVYKGIRITKPMYDALLPDLVTLIPHPPVNPFIYNGPTTESFERFRRRKGLPHNY